MNLKPLYDKIVVKIADKQEVQSSSGLICIKDMSIAKNTTLEADVVAIGTGRLLADGSILPLTVKVGDRVIYSKMQGESYMDGENEYTILSEQHILAIIQNEEE